MEYELTIIADYNDADYDESTSVVTEEELHKLIPLLEKIMASDKPHNFDTLGMNDYDNLGDEVLGPVVDYPDEDPALIARLCELVPTGDSDYGIHTIISAGYCELPVRTWIKGSV